MASESTIKIRGGTYSNLLYRRLLELNTEDFIGKVKAKWQNLKTNQLAPSVVNYLLKHYRYKMINSKADLREKAKWGNSVKDLNTETEYIYTWYVQH